MSPIVDQEFRFALYLVRNGFKVRHNAKVKNKAIIAPIIINSEFDSKRYSFSSFFVKRFIKVPSAYNNQVATLNIHPIFLFFKSKIPELMHRTPEKRKK